MDSTLISTQILCYGDLMNKYRSLILLLIVSAVLFAPFKLPTCPKQSGNAPVALSFSVMPCSVQQVLNSSCFTTPYWLQAEFQLRTQWIVQCFIGVLGFLLVFSKYNSPWDEIYRPPI